MPIKQGKKYYIYIRLGTNVSPYIYIIFWLICLLVMYVISIHIYNFNVSKYQRNLQFDIIFCLNTSQVSLTVSVSTHINLDSHSLHINNTNINNKYMATIAITSLKNSCGSAPCAFVCFSEKCVFQYSFNV